VTKNKDSKKIILVLLSVLLLILGITLALFIGYRRISNQDANLISAVQNQANISLDKVHQTATRNGVKEWTLDARSAHVINAKKQAIFQDLSITFFPKNSSKVYLTSNQGILHTDSNDIEVSGNVVVQNNSYQLKTEILHYKHKERILFSEVPVNIISQTARITADSMSHNLDANKTILKGNIKGSFVDNIIL